MAKDIREDAIHAKGIEIAFIQQILKMNFLYYEKNYIIKILTVCNSTRLKMKPD